MDAVRDKARRAREAALRLQTADDATRGRAVLAVADALRREAPRVLEANRQDVEAAQRDGLEAPLLARLKLTPEKLVLTLDGVRALARMPDPVGRTLRGTLLDDGLRLYQVTVPLGVVACVYESRPDASVQIPALALRSANAVLLKGGAEAERTNAAIVGILRAALEREGLPADAVQRLEGRAEVQELLALDDLVDLVIPRGSNAFVRHVMDRTRIPVLGHAAGVCHVYLDRSADPGKAARIVLDAKTDSCAACNAAETLLVHRDVAPALLPPLAERLQRAGVEVRASERALPHCGGAAKPARPEDFGTEFGDLVLSVDLVDSVEDAVAFVNARSSRHTDAIVTEDRDAARRFVAGVDSAGVYVNASTRFADGYRYGLGAEVGISTSKIHARGPVGLEGLTSTKWVLLGDGHVAADYQGKAPRPFKHEARQATLDAEWRR